MPRSILNVKCQTGMRKCARLGGVTAAALAVISRLQAEQHLLLSTSYLLECVRESRQSTQAPKAPEPSQTSAPAVISRLQAEHKYHGRRAAAAPTTPAPREGRVLRCVAVVLGALFALVGDPTFFLVLLNTSDIYMWDP